MFRRFLCCLLTGIVIVSGCSRPPAPVKIGPKSNTVAEDQAGIALETLRQASELAHYRDALQLLNAHLAQPDVLRRPEISQAKRDALQKLCRLSDEEVDEVAALSFKPLDAHHLEGCYLWLDIARGLEVEGMPALEKARLAQQWVQRRVLFLEHGQEWLPPAYVVRRGHGSARDRALVLVELLRQLGIEACLIGPPGLSEDAATPPLVGVLVKTDDQSSIYLFDPRGLPPAGDSTRTLAEARAKPELLGMDAGQVGKLEAFLAVPLSALAPRMAYLQELSTGHDRVSLFQDVEALRDHVAAAAALPVSVWNAPAKPKTAPPPSPLRALRLFLPLEEGGLDREGRLQAFKANLIPRFAVLAHYQEMRILQAMPEPALQNLDRLTGELFNIFYIQPEEMVLRGRDDAALKRIDRIRTVLEMEDEATPLEEAVLEKRLADWRRRIKETYTALLVRKEADAQAAVNALWTEDSFLLNVLQVDSEIPLKKFAKKTLSYIVLGACKEALGEQVRYLVASSWHEKAAQFQGHADFLRALGKDNRNVQESARHAWANARGEWNKYVVRHNLSPAAARRRFDEVLERWNRGERDVALGHLEQLHLDIVAALTARLRLAEAQERALPNPQVARTTLQDLAADVQQLVQSNARKELTACLESVRGPSQRPLARRLDLLSRNWEEQGGFQTLHALVKARLEKRPAP